MHTYYFHIVYTWNMYLFTPEVAVSHIFSLFVHFAGAFNFAATKTRKSVFSELLRWYFVVVIFLSNHCVDLNFTFWVPQLTYIHDGEPHIHTFLCIINLDSIYIYSNISIKSAVNVCRFFFSKFCKSDKKNNRRRERQFTIFYPRFVGLSFCHISICKYNFNFFSQKKKMFSLCLLIQRIKLVHYLCVNV